MSGNKAQPARADKTSDVGTAPGKTTRAARSTEHGLSPIEELQGVVGNRAICAATGRLASSALGSAIHSGAVTDQRLRALGARAATLGSDVYLRTDVAREPDAPRNRRTLAHEAVHAQQHERWREGAPPESPEALEREARQGGASLAHGRPFRARLGAPPHLPLFAEVEEEEKDAPPADRKLATYWVRPGDTLSKIAKRGTGNPRRYVEIKALNNLTSDDVDVGDGFLIPDDWDLEALGIHRPVDRPGASLSGQSDIAWTFATGRGLAELQRKIDAVSKTCFEGGQLTPDELQFLSDFFAVVYRGAYAKRVTVGPEPKMRLQYYFDAVASGGRDLELRVGLRSQYTTLYAESAVVQRAQPLMHSMIAARARSGELTGTLTGTLTSEDIVKGDLQDLSASFVETQGRIRGKDWDPENKLQSTQRGHLMSEQGNFRMKYTDNNFILRASWVAVPLPNGGFLVSITWSVRDLYLFRSARELRDLGFDPYNFVTPLPTMAGGELDVPDALLQMAEGLGWARRFYSYSEWTETVHFPAPAGG